MLLEGRRWLPEGLTVVRESPWTYWNAQLLVDFYSERRDEDGRKRAERIAREHLESAGEHRIMRRFVR